MVSFPEGAAGPTLESAIEAVRGLAEGNPADGKFRVYRSDVVQDSFEAAAGYGLRMDAAKGGLTLLVRPGEGADIAAFGKAAKAALKDAGGTVRVENSQIAMYDRVMAAIDLMPRTADGKAYVSGSKAVSSVVSKLVITSYSIHYTKLYDDNFIY